MEPTGIDQKAAGLARKIEDVGTFLGDGLAYFFMILYFLVVAVPIGFVFWTLITGPFQ